MEIKWQRTQTVPDRNPQKAITQQGVSGTEKSGPLKGFPDDIVEPAPRCAIGKAMGGGVELIDLYMR